MSDIVERLRDAHENSVQRVNGSNIFAEAADEIERLRAEMADRNRSIVVTDKIIEAAMEAYDDAIKDNLGGVRWQVALEAAFNAAGEINGHNND